MQQTDISVFMQSLRGNQPMIVLAFLLIRSALSIEQLEVLTGLHNDTIRAAVKGLASKGLLYKQLGEHGRATWIPGGDTFFGMLFDQSPKTSDSGSVVGNVESEECINLLSTSTTIKRQSPKTSDSGGKILSVKTIVKAEEDISACLAVLNAGGIYGKKANEIAEDWHIMPDDIRAQLNWVKGEQWDNPAGMVVYRLLNHVIPPPLQENGHSLECKCAECRNLMLTKRYSENVFSAMINRDDGVDKESEEE